MIYQDYTAALKGQDYEKRDHTMHCIDYVRSGILCAADSNLEPFKSPLEEMHGNGVDSFGTNHQCRDFGKLKKWAEMVRYNDDLDAERFEG